jgi:hypothetical protein
MICYVIIRIKNQILEDNAMLELNKFKEMKQISVGQDEEKIKSRVKKVWVALTKPQREEVLNLSGLSVYAAMRTYQKGKISLKLALALAQVQKVNPYFLTGASDDREDYTDDRINQFLTDNGHADLLKECGSKRTKRTGTKKTDGNSPSKPDVNEDTVSTATDESDSNSDSPKKNDDLADDSESKVTQPDMPPVLSTSITPSPNQHMSSHENLLLSIQGKARSITKTEQDKLD